MYCKLALQKVGVLIITPIPICYLSCQTSSNSMLKRSSDVEQWSLCTLYTILSNINQYFNNLISKKKFVEMVPSRNSITGQVSGDELTPYYLSNGKTRIHYISRLSWAHCRTDPKTVHGQPLLNQIQGCVGCLEIINFVLKKNLIVLSANIQLYYSKIGKSYRLFVVHLM